MNRRKIKTSITYFSKIERITNMKVKIEITGKELEELIRTSVELGDNPNTIMDHLKNEVIYDSGAIVTKVTNASKFETEVDEEVVVKILRLVIPVYNTLKGLIGLVSHSFDDIAKYFHPQKVTVVKKDEEEHSKSSCSCNKSKFNFDQVAEDYFNLNKYLRRGE